MSNKNVPQIRFKGFDEDWEEKKIEDVYKRSIEKNDLTYREKDIISVANLYYKPEVKVSSKEYLLSYNVFKLGDIAFEGNKSKDFSHGRFVENTIGDGIVSHVFDVYRPIIPYDIQYWKYAINNENVMRSLLIRCTKSATMMSALVASDFLKQKINVPNLSEQSQIGTLFCSLDKQISCSEAKLDKLRTIKKTLLKKMFAASEENIPQIRFKGFEGAWEEKKLGEIMTEFAYGLNAAAKPYDGNNKYLRITDIDEKTRNFDISDLSSPNCDLNKSDSYLLKDGDIVFARTGASVGKTYIYKNSDGKVYYAGFLIKSSTKGDINPNFVFQKTLTKQYFDYIRLISQRSGQPGVNAQELSEFIFLIPNSCEEQSKIAKIFSSLDKQISNQEQKIEKLKAIKKTLLKKMFV